MTQRDQELKTIGWREWLALPEFGLGCVQAKIDTSHRSSKLYAVELECVATGDDAVMRFVVLPVQGDARTRVAVEAPLVDERLVRTPDGRRQRRPVIRTLVTLGDVTWAAEIALVAHAARGFRLLIGRDAVGRRFLVDPSQSFLAGPPAVN